MRIAYTLRESFSGFRRAKLSATVSVITISIALLLLGTFVVVAEHTAKFVDTLRGKVEMEAFLEQPAGPTEIENIRRQITAIEGVDSVAFVSKDDAARIFREEFGEDVGKVLDFNPFPPSFKVRLKEDHRTAERAAAIEVNHVRGERVPPRAEGRGARVGAARPRSRSRRRGRAVQCGLPVRPGR